MEIAQTVPTWLVVASYGVGSGLWLRWLTVDKPRQGGVDLLSSATPTTILGYLQVSFNLLVVLVPYIWDESAQIDGTHSCANWQIFDNWSEPNRDLFWGNHLVLLIMEKKDLQRHIICLCLDSFVKSHIFRDNLKNNCVSFYVHDEPGLKIRNWGHPRTRFDATNSMVISDFENEPLLKITFLKVSSIVLTCVNCQLLNIQGFVLKIELTLGLVLTSRV